ncbi:hypothetical protein M9Y10_010526 [Tritrichomonas musculus]|uniref:Surface antigen BspA-like n=1 Tax=Tritrichomonas musculus TaxID=1915356 RepID=A0ABR2IM79_9EUKA
MQLYTNGTVTFIQDAFKNTKNLTFFEIHSIGKIDFKTLSFSYSNVNVIDLYTNGQVNFDFQAFLNCSNLTTLTINSPSDVTFRDSSFMNSQIKELNVTYENGTNGAIYLANPSTITFNSDSFKNCNELTKVNVVNADGNVNIKSSSFQNRKSLTKLNAKAEKATIESCAFAGCSSLTDKTIDAHDKDVAPDAFDGGGDDDGNKKKSGSSSYKDSDDDHSWAKSLGNIEIRTVYLGTSPNIALNLNFMLSFFRKVRKTLGHIVPSPDLVHVAIWVSKDGTVFDNSVGTIFVYGRYFNKKNCPVYLDNDGAKAYVMTLKQFKQRYPAIEPMKLNPH